MYYRGGGLFWGCCPVTLILMTARHSFRDIAGHISTFKDFTAGNIGKANIKVFSFLLLVFFVYLSATYAKFLICNFGSISKTILITETDINPVFEDF